MKYKLIKTDLFLNGRLTPEGTIIELSEKESSTLSMYLEELEEIQSDTNVRKINSEIASNSEKFTTKIKRGKNEN